MSNAAGRAKRAVARQQVSRRDLEQAQERALVARQAAALEEENAARMFRFREAHPRVGIQFTMEQRLDVLCDYLADVVPGFDRAMAELRWEMKVSQLITKAEEEADLFVARHEQAEREQALLEGLPVAQTSGGLIVPASAT